MIQLRIEPHPGSCDVARAGESMARLTICALGLAFSFASSTLAEAQTATSTRQARPTLSRETTMAQLTTMDAPAAAAASREAGSGDNIRPFRAHVSDADVADLRRRLQATRWPDKETVADASQGAQLANLRELVRYWGTEYDWRKGEAKLNALPQFITT